MSIDRYRSQSKYRLFLSLQKFPCTLYSQPPAPILGLRQSMSCFLSLQLCLLKSVIYMESYWITNQYPLYSTGNFAQCYAAALPGGEFGGEWMHISGQPSPFAVHLKLPQHCLLCCYMLYVVMLYMLSCMLLLLFSYPVVPNSL